jgi:hypothetical protein
MYFFVQFHCIAVRLVYFFIEGEVHEYDEPSYSVMMPGGEFPGDRGYEMR